MSGTLLLVILAVGWVAITGGFSLLNLLLGALVAAVIIFLLRHQLARPMAASRLAKILALAGLFVVQLLLSALGVARLVLTPNLGAHLRPAIIAFPLKASGDAEITVLANLITLTPGTLSLDISPDRRHLYIHALSPGSRESLINSVARGFEKKVIDVFR